MNATPRKLPAGEEIGSEPNIPEYSAPSQSATVVSLDEAVACIARLAGPRPRRERAALVAISGVDGSGKSHLARLLAARVGRAGRRVALIGIDPWQNPQTVRFSTAEPGPHFYRHAIRFEELFSQVVEPLAGDRALRLETRGIRTDADVWEPLVYDHRDVEVVLLEGIFLIRRDLVQRYDLRIWVECSLDTALRRALARNVENRPPEALREDYARIYHAAQRVHFALDAPRAAADLLLDNERDADLRQGAP
jgi:uridine kinase